mgnify:CR=1 FL=1
MSVIKDNPPWVKGDYQPMGKKLKTCLSKSIIFPPGNKDKQNPRFKELVWILM